MRAQLQDITLEYEISGQGIPLLLVHGFPLNKTMWEPQLAGLAGAAQVITLDLRGHGGSQATPAPYSVDLFAADLASFIDALHIQRRVVVCGLSMGGYVAMAFSRLYPDHLKGLILTATRAGPDSEAAQQGREQSAAVVRSQGIAPVAGFMLPKLLAPKTYHDKPRLVKHLESILLSNSDEGAVGDLLAMKNRPDSLPGLQMLQNAYPGDPWRARPDHSPG